MQRFAITRVCLVSTAFSISPTSAYAQGGLEESVFRPDNQDAGQGPYGHFFGNWGGVSSHLSERGVRLDFRYIYALCNLFTDFESVDPPSTPAMEVRVTPPRSPCVKSMVEAEDRTVAPPRPIEQACATRRFERRSSDDGHSEHAGPHQKGGA